MTEAPMHPSKVGMLIGLVLLLLAGCRASKVMYATVELINDGDTVTLENDEQVRYMGVDTPEVGFKEKKPEPFGREAAAFNRKLVLGKRVRLEVAQKRRDRFGRLLAHLFTTDDLLVGEALLLEGLANCFSFEPHPYEKRYLRAQRNAMKQKKGRWRQWQEPFPKQTYVGNRRSMRFHRADCKSTRSISRKNRVLYRTMWEAYFNGFAPAKGCLP